jgi:hypothetical protein
MDRNDRQAIEDLFGKLASVERQSTPRDAEAEAFIRERSAGQPGAPYYMAQTIVVQEQALAAAQARIEQLEGRRQGGGGMFAGLFGSDGSRRGAGSPPSLARQPHPAAPQAQQSGGFLAGAAQTAIGVAGGVLLGNAIGGLFAGHEAEAAEVGDDGGEPEPDDGGFGDGGFGDFDL